MLHEVFYWFLNMSIASAVAGVCVLLLRRIRTIPRRVAVFFWLAPFLRMCVPFGINSPYGLMALLSKLTTKTVTVFAPAEHVAFSTTNFMMAANRYYPITYKVDSLEGVFTVAALVWLVVFLAILLALGALYATTLRELRDAKMGEGDVFYSEKVTSAAVYGVLHPKIVLPARMQEEDISYVLRHEKAHIRRGDNLWRVLGFALAAAHWFNPLAWVSLKRFLEDLELACDEKVLSGLDAAQGKEYARSLLRSQESSNLFASHFGGAAIRTRIENILSFRKMTCISAAGFSALLLAVLTVLLTNAG